MPALTAATAFGLFAALAAAAPAATANPLKVGSVQVLGYRNSTNTESLRDLGFMGNIGQNTTGHVLAKAPAHHQSREHVDAQFRRRCWYEESQHFRSDTASWVPERRLRLHHSP